MFLEKDYDERRRFARRLRELRLRQGMTQVELSRRMGFAHSSTISSIEHARRLIHHEELPAFAVVLNCSVDELLTESKDAGSGSPAP